MLGLFVVRQAFLPCPERLQKGPSKGAPGHVPLKSTESTGDLREVHLLSLKILQKSGMTKLSMISMLEALVSAGEERSPSRGKL